MSVESVQNFHIYRSSAGSGKTYTLTREYLKLALRNLDYYRLILAVTFTNKATEEMKTRIVESLHKLSKGAHPMSEELRSTLGINQQQLEKRAKEVLKRILHNYSSFAITTIDAFFQKVVRSFAREVGVQGGFQVEMNQRKVIEEVVDSTIAGIGSNTVLTQWLIEFAIYKISEGQSWEVRRDIKLLSQELFKEVFVGHREEIFDKILEPGFMNSLMDDLVGIKKNFEDKLVGFGVEAKGHWERAELTVDDFFQKKSGPAGFLNKLSHGEVIAPNSYVNKALQTGEWAGKSAPKKDLVQQTVHGGLQQCLEQTLAFYDQEKEHYHTALQLIRYLYTVGILGQISQELTEYRDENDLLLISDFPVFLNEIIQGGDAPYIYEKIGSKYHHYLIDEFQDTSGLQWENFKPLIQDSIATGKFSMVVGDIKQSIYRWRGGNWRLLLEKIQADIGDAYTKLENLEWNWRSKRNIIEFNNSFFTSVPLAVSEFLTNEAGQKFEEIENISYAYQDAGQKRVEDDKKTGGLVTFKVLEKTEEASYEDLLMPYLIETIQSLQDANYNLRDIAILVRRKDEGNKVVKALQAMQEKSDTRYKYDIISNESLFLRNAPVVHFLLSVIEFLHIPDEVVHKEEVQYAYYHHIHGEAFQEGDSLGEKELLNPCELLMQHRDRLHGLSLFDLVEEVIRTFNLKKIDDQLAYLVAFQDAVIDYSRQDNGGLEGFLSWWEHNNDRSIQVSEDQEAMRLMTIHKSKGLQFKVVLIPFCSWKLDHNPLHENILWNPSGGIAPYASLSYLPLRYKKSLNDTLYKEGYWAEKAKAYMDNLNLLYVAFTRAEEALYVMTEAKDPKSRGLQKVSDIVSDYFTKETANGPNFVQKESAFELGSMDQYSVYEENINQEEALLDYVSRPWFEGDGLNIKSSARWNSEEVVSKISIGTITHYTLSKIKYLEDVPAAIASAKNYFSMTDEEVGKIESLIDGLFKKPTIVQWFKAPWKVKNEAAIVKKNGQVLRPDRFLYDDEKSVVIDFKTGGTSGRHNQQVLQYMEVLKEMGYAKVEGYILYLANLELVPV